MRFPVTLLFIFLFASAIAQESRADLIRKLKTAPEDTAKVNIYGKIALAYVGINFDSAIDYAQQGLTLAKKLDDDPAVGRMYNANASVLIQMGLFTESKAYADSSVAIAKAENDNKLLSNAYINIGNFYRTRNNIDSAIYFYSQSLALKEPLNDSIGLSACYNSLGFCNYQQGNVKSALDYYYKAVAIRDALGDKKGLANTYLNISFIHMDRGETKPALETLDKSYHLYTELGNTQSIANVSNAYGIVYMTDKDYPNALKWYGLSLELRSQLGDSAGMAESYNNIGNIYNVQNKHDSAIIYYRKTIALLNYATPDAQVTFLANYSTSAATLGKTDSARWALSIAEEITKKDYRPDLLISLYGGKSTYYEVIGKFDSALYYVRLTYHLSDSVYRADNLKALGEMETKYQTTKKQKEIDDLTAAQKQKDLQLLSLSIGIGLMIILISYVIYGSIQRKKTNRLLALQNQEISEKNKDITDSITYARRIQQSVLPDEDVLFSNVIDAFIFYQPRDIVSGDFYWFRKEGSRLYVACADCTGHGVPGALVSVIGVNLLEQIVTAKKSISTGELLDQLHRMMYVALHKDSLARGSTDGMDIGVLCIDTAANKVEFSGASRPLFHYTGKTLTQVKGERYSIGGVREVESASMFKTNEFSLEKGDAFYLFTDGYADQFGGRDGKKFMSKKFFELIATNTDTEMKVQQTMLDRAFKSWKGSNAQVDDVLVIGVRV